MVMSKGINSMIGFRTCGCSCTEDIPYFELCLCNLVNYSEVTVNKPLTVVCSENQIPKFCVPRNSLITQTLVTLLPKCNAAL